MEDNKNTDNINSEKLFYEYATNYRKLLVDAIIQRDILHKELISKITYDCIQCLIEVKKLQLQYDKEISDLNTKAVLGSNSPSLKLTFFEPLLVKDPELIRTFTNDLYTHLEKIMNEVNTHTDYKDTTKNSV